MLNWQAGVLIGAVVLGAWLLWPGEEDEGPQVRNGASDEAGREAPVLVDRSRLAPEARELMRVAGLAGASFVPEDWDPVAEKEEWRRRSRLPAEAEARPPEGLRPGTGDFIVDDVAARSVIDTASREGR